MYFLHYIYSTGTYYPHTTITLPLLGHDHHPFFLCLIVGHFNCRVWYFNVYSLMYDVASHALLLYSSSRLEQSWDI